MDDVRSGKIKACKWVKLCIERHLKDLKTGSKRGLWHDPDAAQHVIDFFQFLKHSKGEWAGQVFNLEPWQQFIIWVLFGWKNKDGTRRFRIAYIEVGRKNGKSTYSAGIGLYLLVAEEEPGAEIYTVATKLKQARIIHSEAVRMVKSSPSLRKRVAIFKDNLNIEATASKFEPLGKDSDTEDGLNTSGGLIDELHAHKNREMWDVMDTSTGARRQPLLGAITTAGFDRESICYEQHIYTENILEETIKDNTFFGIIYTIDEGDDWEDESNWIKANPNLGVSVKWDDLRRKAKKAKQLPTALNAFLRKHLDIWTESETRWILPEVWETCNFSVDREGLRGRRCYAGLDLASTTDISALILVFPPETKGDQYQILCRFWVPQENITLRSKRDRVPYETWTRQGFIEVTPGNVIDYSYIFAQIDEDAQNYDVKELAFDRWGATEIIQSLQDKGMEVVKFGQGFASMSPPSKELEKLILSKKISHGGNPVLGWMAANVIVTSDAAGNIKPDKKRSREKIDGITALVMGLDRALRHEGKSAYEDRGILRIGEDGELEEYDEETDEWRKWEGDDE